MKLYRLIGLHIEDYRSRGVELMHLKRGDCVLDLGCGTGLNFPHLFKQIGPDGRIIGVDISSEMLNCARKRVELEGWRNVELVHSDIAEYMVPANINGVISTGVFGYVPEREQILGNVSQALKPGGRIAIIDGKRPDQWPAWLFKTFVKLSSPFGLTAEYFDGHTWRLVVRFFQDTAFEEMYGGLLYISSGTATGPSAES